MHQISKLTFTHLEKLAEFQEKIFSSYENAHKFMRFKPFEDLKNNITTHNYYGMFINSKLCGVVSFHEKQLSFAEDMVLSHINSIKIPENFCYLEGAAVLKEYEGNKIMSRLINHALEEIKKEGHGHVVTTVNGDNAKMLHITQKKGFKYHFNIERISNNRGKFSFLSKEIQPTNSRK